MIYVGRCHLRHSTNSKRSWTLQLDSSSRRSGRERTAAQQLEANIEQIRILSDQIVILTEQVADLTRRLFGNRSEKLPTVKETFAVEWIRMS